MKDITSNEMLFVLSIFKNPKKEYNASNLAKTIGISPMGALKIAKRLEKEGILISKQMGKARFYKINTKNDYVRHYITFLLKREVEQATAYIKMWVNEIRKIKNADSAVLFGSVLRKSQANDIDVLLVTDKKRFFKVKKEIEGINLMNNQKIHPVYQSKDDLKENIKKEDQVILNAIKGLFAFGEEKIMRLMEK